MRDTIRCTGPSTATVVTGDFDPGEGREFVLVECACGRYSERWNTTAGSTPTPWPHVRPGARLAEVLRDAAAAGQHGWARTPDNFYVGSGDPDRPGYVYWARQNLNGRDKGLTDAEVRKLAQLSARYLRLVHLAREVWPEWEKVREVHYMDNSIEEEHRSRRTGATRMVMTLGPGGDACF